MKIRLLIASLFLATIAHADFNEFTPETAGGSHSKVGSGSGLTTSLFPHCRSVTGGSTGDGEVCNYCAQSIDCPSYTVKNDGSSARQTCDTGLKECRVTEGGLSANTGDYLVPVVTTQQFGPYFAVDDVVRVSVFSGDTMPGGLVIDTDYHITTITLVSDVPTRIYLSATQGGSSIDITSTGTAGSVILTRQSYSCSGACTTGFCLTQSGENGDAADECTLNSDCDSVCTGVHWGKGWLHTTEPAFISNQYDSEGPGSIHPSLNAIHCYAGVDPDQGTPGRFGLHGPDMEYCDGSGYRQIVVRQGANSLRIDGRIWSRASTISLEPADGYDLDVNMSSTGSVDLNTKTLNVFAGSLAGDLTAEFSGRTSTDDAVLKLGYAGTPLFAIGQDGADANKLKIVSGDWGNDSTYEAITITSGTLPTIRMNSGGDLIVDAYSLFVDASTNRVGIGTAAPGAPLEVVGAVRAGSFSINGTTCLDIDTNSATDRIYHDTDCDAEKEAGEEFIDQAGGAGSDTNADTQCAGTTTYLDGEGNCDTLNGAEDFETATDDGVLLGNGSTFDSVVIPDCDTASTSKLLYDQASNTFTCGTDTDTNTNAGTECSGTQTYMNGSGACVLIAGLENIEASTASGIPVGNGYPGLDYTIRVIPECADNGLLYSQTSRTFSCDTTDDDTPDSDAEVPDALTIAGGTIGTSAITLVQSADPSPTAEGVIEWETDTNEIHVGDSSGTQVFVAGAHIADTTCNGVACTLSDDIIQLVDSASFSTTTGQLSWDDDSTPKMATIGDGTNALPMRSCWAGGRNGFLSTNKNSWGMLLGHGDLDILNNHALQIGGGGNCATSECYGRGNLYGQLGYDQAPADIIITNLHCRLHNDAKVDIDWTFDIVKVTDPENCTTYLSTSGGSSICWDTDITNIVASTACTIKGETNINEHECGDGTGGVAWAATDSFSIAKGDLMSLRASVNTAPTGQCQWSCSFLACIEEMP